MRELPNGWLWTTLGEACEITQGQSPPGSSYNATGHGLPFFQGKADFGELHPTARSWCSAPKKLAEAEDILISIRAPVGPTNIAEGRCCIGRGLAALRARDDIHQRYVLHWLRLSEPELAHKASGSTFASVTGSQLAAHPLPLAPLTEQRRIVSEIEKQLSTLDSATNNLRLVAAKAALYRNSYLNTIFGRSSLYSLDPDARESSAALAEVVQERRSLQRGRRAVEPMPPETVEDLPLPPGWIVASIDQVCSQVTDGEHIQPPYQEDGLPMLSATHVRGDSVTFAGAGLIRAEAFAAARARCAPAMGDILVVSVGATTGRVGKVKTSEPFALVRSVLLLKPLIKADFLLRWLQSLHAQKWIKRASGSTAQPHLYIRDIKRMPIPFAPPPVQDRVASAVEERLSDLAGLQATVQAAASRAARLRQAILKKAFEGKLVPPDPNDEPASVLLERIRAARAQATARRAPRKREART